MNPDKRSVWLRQLDQECPYQIVLPSRQLADDSEILNFLLRYAGKFNMYVEDDYAAFVRYCFEDPLDRSEEHTSELQSLTNLVCRLLLEKKNSTTCTYTSKAPALSALTPAKRTTHCVTAPLPASTPTTTTPRRGLARSTDRRTIHW